MDADLKKHIFKTGTTTIGIVTKEGVVLAADTRGTYGGDSGVSYIAGRDERKIEKVNENIAVTIAGTASDIQNVIRLTRAELKLKELKDAKKPTIKESAGLFSSLVYQKIRHPSIIISITHFLLAGFDEKQAYLYDIHPDGYIQEITEYAATGSGLIHVNPILDSEYKKGLTLEEGIELAKKCVKASSRRDPGSGEGMDIFTITKDGIKQVVKQKIESVYTEQV